MFVLGTQQWQQRLDLHLSSFMPFSGLPSDAAFTICYLQSTLLTPPGAFASADPSNQNTRRSVFLQPPRFFKRTPPTESELMKRHVAFIPSASVSSEPPRQTRKNKRRIGKTNKKNDEANREISWSHCELADRSKQFCGASSERYDRSSDVFSKWFFSSENSYFLLPFLISVPKQPRAWFT